MLDATAETAAIRAAHPMKSGRHDLYDEAMRLVGARHSKGDLVDLVVWLLLRAEPAAAEIAKLRAALEAAEDVEASGREVGDFTTLSELQGKVLVPKEDFNALKAALSRLR